jgi:hypothetical protein
MSSIRHHAPARQLVALSTADAREYWRHQSIIDGTDWASLGRDTARAFWRIGFTSSSAWSSS